MANNRLYIKDTLTGESLMIAKSGGDGWYFRFWDNEAQKVLSLEEASDWLGMRDWKCQYGGDETTLKLLTEQQLIDDKL